MTLSALALVLFAAPVHLAAQTPDASDIAEGARLFRQKGNCQSCHGWAGDGRKIDGRCYGLKQADLRQAGQRMSDPPATLQNREIEYIADFMFAKIIDKGPMNREKCVEYWGQETEACGEFPK